MRVKWAERKLVVHAGLSKTGSTALQSFFAQNRRVFQTHGVLIPSYDGARNHRLYRALLQTSDDLRQGPLCHPWGRTREFSPLSTLFEK